jgi:hypothetical protein
VKNKKFNNTTDKKTPIPHGGRKQNKVWFWRKQGLKGVILNSAAKISVASLLKKRLPN